MGRPQSVFFSVHSVDPWDPQWDPHFLYRALWALAKSSGGKSTQLWYLSQSEDTFIENNSSDSEDNFIENNSSESHP